MAGQKSRRTPSTRGMRRSHDTLTKPALSVEPTTGETHRRHHVQQADKASPAYYRGKKVIDAAEDDAE